MLCLAKKASLYFQSVLISYQKNIGNKTTFTKGMRLNVSLADLSALKALAKIPLCLEVFLKSHVVKSQSGSCRRRFLGILYLIIIFFYNILKCSLLHHLAELLGLNFSPLIVSA